MATNFYKYIKAKDKAKQKCIGPYTLPNRLIFIGCSGSGKTNCLLNFIHETSGCFLHIIIFCRSEDEPLYNFLKSKIDKDDLTFIEVTKPDDIIPLDDVPNETLVVFDDLILMENQHIISEYFIRARKKQITVCYLSQSYYGIPKLVRLNTTYIILKKINSTRDLAMILSDFPLDMKKEDLKALYSKTIHQGIESYLMIDTNKSLIYSNGKLVTTTTL